ncbi:PSP1 C-terminal domain protein [Candidatus Gastranaerophilus sp. (ex Termes propinquus)]|nr:PSP1 C-terminal domain protein [Candidatus Gastranaerophilus sp. (ex Termes propinquus)]
MKFAVRTIKNSYRPLDVTEEKAKELEHGQFVLVNTDRGEEAFKLIKVNSEIAACWEKRKTEPVSLVRVMTKPDLERLEELKKEEVKALYKCREFVGNRKLSMNLTQARYTFDKKKVTFYYTAPERVDFRELLKDLTQEFKRTRIDLRHIGVRDESSILQGEGVCGQNYCCCKFLKKFENINAKLATEQGIPMTPSKITGACGRLLCCLSYEYPNYIEAAKCLPPVGSSVMTPDGVGKVCQLNFLQKKVSVKFADGKIKEYQKCKLEMIDQEVNIEIDISQNNAAYQDTEEQVDIKALEDDKNSSTGNV